MPNTKYQIPNTKYKIPNTKYQTMTYEQYYTDGSCTGNNRKDISKRRAGWGFVHVIDGEAFDSAKGIVTTDEKHRDFIGAKVLSNNTAELSAMYFALEDMECSGGHKVATIMYDSEYASKSIQGIFNGDKNKALILKCRDKLSDVGKTRVKFKHVKGHSGDKFNDMADKLAGEACKHVIKPRHRDMGRGRDNRP
jgi:ribonuclease HI